MRDDSNFSAQLLLILITSLAFLSISITTAQEYSLDISGLSNEKYNPGEEINFKIILLQNEKPISEQVEYKVSDILNKKEITGQANPGEEISIKIEDDFLSGIWTIKANYADSEVERRFTIGEKSTVKFIIENDELIIKNTGNIRYTKTIEITIGTEKNTYTQNIKAGEQKTLKLISADGEYNIKVTDGTTTLNKKNVQLFGTGNVIGAVDEDLLGYTGFAGTEDVAGTSDRKISLKKLPLSLIFIAAVAILAILVVIIKKIEKKKKSSTK